jgi:hypothetical protein
MTDALFKSEPAAPEGGQTGEPEASHFEQLVGEGKKFADPEALARGKAEADRHIANLEEELSGMREDLNSRLNMQNFLDRLERSGVTNPASQQAAGDVPTEDRDTETAGLSMKDIEALVSQKLNETTVEAQRSQNTELVLRKLKENLGPTYGDRVKEVMTEMEVGEEFMKDLAASKPTAFLKLVGADKAPAAPQNPASYTAPRTQVSTVAVPASGTKTQTYYDKLKSTDPKRYWSREVQAEIHREAQRQGERFFDK